MPEPVGADSSTCSPEAIAGHACSWAAVGAAKADVNQSRTRGEKECSASTLHRVRSPPAARMGTPAGEPGRNRAGAASRQVMPSTLQPTPLTAGTAWLDGALEHALGFSAAHRGRVGAYDASALQCGAGAARSGAGRAGRGRRGASQTDVAEWLAEIEALTLFFDREWKAVPSHRAEALLADPRARRVRALPAGRPSDAGRAAHRGRGANARRSGDLARHRTGRGRIRCVDLSDPAGALSDVAAALAPSTPTPGAGVVAGGIVTLVAGLCESIARAAIESWPDGRGAVVQAVELRRRAHALAAENAAAYQAARARLAEPAGATGRDGTLRAALMRAADAPLAICATAADCALLAAAVAHERPQRPRRRGRRRRARRRGGACDRRAGRHQSGAAVRRRRRVQAGECVAAAEEACLAPAGRSASWPAAGVSGGQALAYGGDERDRRREARLASGRCGSAAKASRNAPWATRRSIASRSASIAGIATAAAIHAGGGAAVVRSAAASSISRFSSSAITQTDVRSGGDLPSDSSSFRRPASAREIRLAIVPGGRPSSPAIVR